MNNRPPTGGQLTDARCLDVIRGSGGALLAVSGGADSTALLCALVKWGRSPDCSLRLEAIHVDHLLRGEAGRGDAAFVRELCRKVGVPFHMRTISDPRYRPSGETLEEFLRRERYRCFREVLAETGLQVLATGHTADDLAESFLMHLMRGAGLRGLSFRPVSPLDGGVLVRPLWQSSRRGVEEYLRAQGQGFRHDETNLSQEFTRNRVRHLLLPFLEEHFNPVIRETLTKTAMRLSSAERFLRRLVQRELGRLQTQSGCVRVLNLENLAALDDFLQGEILGEWVRKVTRGKLRPGSAQLEQLLHTARAGQGRVDLAGGCSVHADGGLLELRLVEERQDETESVARYLRACPGVPFGRIPAREISFSPAVEGESDWHASVVVQLGEGETHKFQFRYSPESGKVPSRLVLRNRLPGDRVSPSVKLKEVLINDKVPAGLRDRLLVVADQGGQVYHVVGCQRINARLRKGVPAARFLLVSVA